MAESRQFGFETRQVHAGQRPDPNTGARAVPHLPGRRATSSRIRNRRPRISTCRSTATRTRGFMNPTVAVLEEARGESRGRMWRGGLCQRDRRAGGRPVHTAGAGRPRGVVVGALRKGTVNQLKHYLGKMSVELSWVDPDDPDDWRRAVRARDQGVLRRDHRQPWRERAGHRGPWRPLPTSTSCPLLVDNTFATPYLCQPLRWGSGHRAALRHQVHRGARDQHRWARRRVRGVQLVERPLSGGGPAVARLSRAGVPRDVWNLWLPHEAEGGDAAGFSGLP